MRLAFLTLLIFLILNLGVDFYIFRALMSDIKKQIWCKIQFWTAIVFATGMIILMLLPLNSLSDSAIRVLMWVGFTYIAVYFAKYTFVIFDVCSRIPQLFHRTRFKWLSTVGGVLGVLGFIWLWWGALYTRYTIDVKEVSVSISDLPENFEGFKIVQISDMHLGTYGGDTTYISKLVDKINSLEPDIVLFTGDIVNRN